MIEYKVIKQRMHNLEAALNTLAADGWRVVSTTTNSTGFIVATLVRTG